MWCLSLRSIALIVYHLPLCPSPLQQTLCKHTKKSLLSLHKTENDLLWLSGPDSTWTSPSHALKLLFFWVFSQRWKSHVSSYTLIILIQMNMNENESDHSSDLISSAWAGYRSCLNERMLIKTVFEDNSKFSFIISDLLLCAFHHHSSRWIFLFFFFFCQKINL